MASYNFYEVKNTLSLQEKKFDTDLFGFNSIDFKQVNNDLSGFIFYTCHITKEYKDAIYIFDGTDYVQQNNYKKIGRIDLFLKDNTIFARGNYQDRLNFDRALRNSEISTFLNTPKGISLNLLNVVNDYEKFKSLSIKDFSATINKLKTSGQMSIEDTDITDFIKRSNDITATTIIYPFNDDEYDIHIDKNCTIRFKDGDFDSAIETQLVILNSFYNEFIKKYKE